FSSRRRHTRSKRDWSSDVCSSDLRVAIMNHGRIITDGTPAEIIEKHGSGERLDVEGDKELADYLREKTGFDVTYGKGIVSVRLRSEERRVGKECRSGWWPHNVRRK